MSNEQQPHEPTPYEQVPYVAPSTELVPLVGGAPTTPAGWYSDQRSGLMRWWDGTGWTEHFGPAVAPFAQQSVYALPRKESGTAYVLLIFLGALGIHRFYLGKTGSAVAMLVMWLVGWSTSILVVGWFLVAAVWVWQIVDLFLVRSMVREVNARAAASARYPV
jgi:TM2 domain-containing membrane protein YozV